MTAQKRPKKKKLELPPIKADEREQVRIRRRHGFDLLRDEFGRERVPNDTAEGARRYDESKSGVLRLRTADPLNEISLSDRQRNAGRRFRSDYETASQSGIKPASMDQRVDMTTMPRDVSGRVLEACRAVYEARKAMDHHEIVGVVEQVCGLRRSIREIAERTHDPRPALTKLLTIGLDKLADTYFGPLKTRIGSGPKHFR